MTYPQSMTEVTNIKTGDKFIYSLPSEEAVRVAYIQHVMCRWDTWNYATVETPDVKREQATVSCGDFVFVR